MQTKILQPGQRAGSVKIPCSKSLAHRYLIAAALTKFCGNGHSRVWIERYSDDLNATFGCIHAILRGDSLWPCGESASTLRFLTPVAGVLGRKGQFLPEGRLAERPMIPFEKRDEYFIPGDISSQFVSGLLMALPLAYEDSTVRVKGRLQGAPYVKLTEQVLAESGIDIGREDTPDGPVWHIRGRQRYNVRKQVEVEGDWSQAAFWLAMGVRAEGLSPDSIQGDRVVTDLLGKLGNGAVIDVADIPDLVPPLAAKAAIAQGQTRFVNAGRLRLKESNRLLTTAALINAVGGRARITDRDELIIDGVERLPGGVADSRGDHRIAMAAAVLANYAKRPVTVLNAECVAKSYPGFWEDFDSLAICNKEDIP